MFGGVCCFCKIPVLYFKAVITSGFEVNKSLFLFLSFAFLQVRGVHKIIELNSSSVFFSLLNPAFIYFFFIHAMP